MSNSRTYNPIVLSRHFKQNKSTLFPSNYCRYIKSCKGLNFKALTVLFQKMTVKVMVSLTQQSLQASSDWLALLCCAMPELSNTKNAILTEYEPTGDICIYI